MEKFNSNILSKCEKLSQLVSTCNEITQIISPTFTCGDAELEEFCTNYRLGTVELHSASNSDISDEFFRIVIAENYLNTLKNIADKVVARAAQLLADCTEMAKTADISTRRALLVHTKKIDNIINSIEHIQLEVCKGQASQNCECGNAMKVLCSSSELYCDNCGIILKIVGVIFDDIQLYNQEGQRSKHSTYIPSRHYKFWRDRIHAREERAFPQEHLDKILNRMRKDRIYVNSLNCRLVRRYLKLCDLTSYNDHAGYLTKLFSRGQKEPPKFTEEDDRLISMKFNYAMELLERLRGSEANRPYYPYFYYKICDDEFGEWPNGNNRADGKKIEILDWIYLQSEETVIKHDKIYKELSDLSDGRLRYRPTRVSFD